MRYRVVMAVVGAWVGWLDWGKEMRGGRALGGAGRCIIVKG